MPHSSFHDVMWSIGNLLNPHQVHADANKRRNSQIVAEAVFAELEFQVKQADENARMRKRQENERQGRPDYTWLMDSKQSYKVPHTARLELEDICRSIDPNDLHRLIREFRLLISQDTTPETICTYMKFVLSHHIQKQNMMKDGPKKRYPFHLLASSSLDAANIVDAKYGIIKNRNSSTELRSVSAITMKTGDLKTISEETVERSQTAPISTWKMLRKGKILPVNHPCYVNEELQRTHLVDPVPMQVKNSKGNFEQDTTIFDLTELPSGSSTDLLQNIENGIERQSTVV